MAYYYSASERAFFSSEIMSVDAMPSDKVAVADQTYKQLMADQVAGKLIRTGSGNAPESVDQGLTAATRFGDVSFGKVTGTSLDINGNGDVSGTFVVGGAVTIKGSLNAQGGLNVTSITATGTSTLAAVNATNISASGTLKVNGSSTLQAVSAKKVTATELDLNGNGDVSGNLVVHGKTTLEALQANGDATIGGLLKVTGQSTYGNRITFNTNQWLFGSRSDVSVADTERDSATNIIVYRIADKDGAALISEEAYFNQDGSRDLRFNGRNRANTSWRLFLTIKEYANEEVRIIAADSPSASVNDHTLITAKWANEAFAHKTGEETINGKKTFGRELTVTARNWTLTYLKVSVSGIVFGDLEKIYPASVIPPSSSDLKSSTSFCACRTFQPHEPKSIFVYDFANGSICRFFTRSVGNADSFPRNALDERAGCG